MSRFKVAVFAVFFAALSTVPATARDRDDDHPKRVKVVNTPNVNVVNTPTVNVGTLPAVQLAPGAAVGIAGTPSVQITNDPANPVPVHDASTPNRTPFQVSLDFTLTSVSDTEPIPVPEGKRLVIEYFSASAFAADDQKLVFGIETQMIKGQNILHPMLSTSFGDFGHGQGSYTVSSQVVKLFSNPGTTVSLTVFRSLNNGGPDASGSFAISGYLEDAP